MTILPKGTILNGPDGQAYELTENVDPSAGALPSRAFKPLGDTLAIVPNTIIPQWILNAINTFKISGMSSDRFIANADANELVGLVMKLTGGSVHPDLPRAQIENAKKRAEARE